MADELEELVELVKRSSPSSMYNMSGRGVKQTPALVFCAEKCEAIHCLF